MRYRRKQTARGPASAIETEEFAALAELLARHFVDVYGARSVEEARPVAEEELGQMAELCADHAPNTVLTVIRELTPSGVREQFRFIEGNDARSSYLSTVVVAADHFDFSEYR